MKFSNNCSELANRIYFGEIKYPEISTRMEKLIAHWTDTIEKGEAQRFTRENLSTIYGKCFSTFYREWRTISPVTPLKLYSELRILDLVATFRKHPRMTTMDLCYSGGYTAHPGFLVNFKHCTGMTPRQYRKMLLAGGVV